MEHFYEIRNIKTKENAQIIAPNFTIACELMGWKAKDCRCVWKAHPENATAPENY